MNIKPIRTEQDYTASMARIDELWGAEIGTPEGDELEVLALLVSTYEDEHAPMPPLSFSEGDCTSSLGWPPCVHRTSDRERSEVLCTKRRERSELLRTLVHGATKPEPPKIPAINRQAA